MKLAEKYQASRTTVRRAVAVLRAEGLVVTRQGLGAFVRPVPLVRLRLTAANYRRHRQERVPGFNAQVLEQGQRPEQRLLVVEPVDAPNDVADRLHSWASLDGAAEIVVFDDRSEPGRIAPGLSELALRCDLLLGPYSTQLMRAANKVVAGLDTLLWNHGGSGDDAEAAAPGHVISVLAPTSRYAEPFVRMLARDEARAPLWLRSGRGRFGTQVIDGAERIATQFDLSVHRVSHGDPLPSDQTGPWDFFTAATYPEDVETVREVLELPRPPRILGAVAAGVHEFGRSLPNPHDIYGIAQWLPGRRTTAHVGPSEEAFLGQYRKDSGDVPDYPAVQAAAAAALAAHCARTEGDRSRPAVWSAATGLRTTTLLGHFAVDPITGAQLVSRAGTLDHQPVLTRWTTDGMSAVEM